MNNLPDYINVGASAGTNAEIQTNAGTNAGIQTNMMKNAGMNVNRQSLATQLTGIADQLKSIATSLSTNAPMPSSKVNRNTGLAKTKRVRSAAQLARNENIKKAYASLKEKGYKSSLKSVHDLLKHRKEGKKNEDYFSTLGLPTITEVVEEAVVAEGEGNATGATGAEVKNHATAGKKAVTSEKGGKWLEEIKSAKNLINSEYTKSGLKKTAKRQNATKVASLMRKNEAAARNYINQLMKA